MQKLGRGKMGTEGSQKESWSGDEPGWPEGEQAWLICGDTTRPTHQRRGFFWLRTSLKSVIRNLVVSVYFASVKQ